MRARKADRCLGRLALRVEPDSLGRAHHLHRDWLLVICQPLYPERQATGRSQSLQIPVSQPVSREELRGLFPQLGESRRHKLRGEFLGPDLQQQLVALFRFACHTVLLLSIPTWVREGRPWLGPLPLE